MNPALRLSLGVVFLLPMALQSVAAEAYECIFARECPTGQACIEYDSGMVQLSRDDDDTSIWTLTTADGEAIPFTRMSLKAREMNAFVSSSFDPGASAVSLLSVFDDGQAFLSIHGVFFSPGSVTHLGTCVPKDG